MTSWYNPLGWELNPQQWSKVKAGTVTTGAVIGGGLSYAATNIPAIINENGNTLHQVISSHGDLAAFGAYLVEAGIVSTGTATSAAVCAVLYYAISQVHCSCGKKQDGIWDDQPTSSHVEEMQNLNARSEDQKYYSFDPRGWGWRDWTAWGVASTTGIAATLFATQYVPSVFGAAPMINLIEGVMNSTVGRAVALSIASDIVGDISVLGGAAAGLLLKDAVKNFCLCTRQVRDDARVVVVGNGDADDSYQGPGFRV